MEGFCEHLMKLRVSLNTDNFLNSLLYCQLIKYGSAV